MSLSVGELAAGVLNDSNYTEVGIFSCTILDGCFSSELLECAVSCAPQYTCLEVFITLTVRAIKKVTLNGNRYLHQING